MGCGAWTPDLDVSAVVSEIESSLVVMTGPGATDLAVGAYEITNGQVATVFNVAREAGSVSVDATSVMMGDKVLIEFYASEYGANTGLRSIREYLGVVSGRDDHPAIGLTWYGAIVFCNLLSEAAGLNPVYDPDTWTADFSRNGYRLPTYEEWVFAAEGGSGSHGYTYAGSNDPAEVAWYGPTSDGSTHPVGKLTSNELGLFDMNGNVWEWCWDSYDSDYDGSGHDASDTASGQYRAWAGGGWNTRSFENIFSYPNVRDAMTSDNDLGLRLVRQQ
jgi:formylglycine-generating enzyme required for sulfatase activity